MLESLEEKQAKIKELIQKNKTLDKIKEFFGLKDESSSGRRWPSIVIGSLFPSKNEENSPV